MSENTVSPQEGRPARGGHQTEQQYLTFMLGGEVFAIGILTIKEIIEYGDLTPVPMTPTFVRGVINLRGAVMPVVDLAMRFGRQGVQASRRTCIVILEITTEDGKQDIGVIVDGVNAVIEIAQNQIEPPPAFGAKIRSEFIQGIGKVDNRFVMILNPDRILLMDELILLERRGERHEAQSACISVRA